VAVAPRLLVSLTGGAERPPLGEEVWGETRLLLPDSLSHLDLDRPRLRDRLTGEGLPVVAFAAGRRGEAGRGLPLAAVLSRFPVALLELAE
jgi:hypothetical protein